MLQALTNPERASYESLQAALERWESPEVQIRQEEGPVWDQRGVADERLREIGAQGPRDPPDAQLHPLQNLRRDGAGSHQLHRSQDREPNGGVIQLCQAEHFEWSCGHGH